MLPADVSHQLEVLKAPQTITFNALSEKTVDDDPFDLNATTSSGLSITYTSSDESVATISGSTVTILGVGTTLITASQSGNQNYEEATEVSQSLNIIDPAKATQTISFGELESKTYGDADFNITATASSGLNVSFTSLDESVATVTGNTVTIVGAGTTMIMASQGRVMMNLTQRQM